jgi:hypothetical protein
MLLLLLIPGGLLFPVLVKGQLSLSLSAGVAGELGIPPVSLPSRDPGPYSVAKEAAAAFENAFGSGINTHLRLNYAISRHLSLELDASLFSGFFRTNTQDINGNVEIETQLNSPRIVVNPGIVLGTGWRIFSPYLRAGVLLPGHQPVRLQKEIRSDTDVWTREIQIKGQTNFGWSASLGFSYQLSSQLRLFYEMEHRAHTARFKKANLLSYQRNGTDVLEELAPHQIAARFYPELPPMANHPDSPDFDPDLAEEIRGQKKELRQMTSNLGIIISLN